MEPGQAQCPNVAGSAAAFAHISSHRGGLVYLPQSKNIVQTNVTLVRAARSFRLWSVDVALDPGPSRAAEVQVAPAGARWMREPGTVRVRIDVHTFPGQLLRAIAA